MAETINKKAIKKKFFEIDIPLTATKAKLYAANPEELKGRIIVIDMTKNLRGKNVELRAKVEVDKEEITSELVSLIVIPSAIRRVMRRGTDYVEDSFTVSCKDALLRIKPFMITRNRVSRTVRNELRVNARKILEAYTTIKTVREIFSEVMTNKLQKTLSLRLKKIYPLAFCEIRWIEIVGKPEAKKVKEETISQ